jgi:hypothetical protein
MKATTYTRKSEEDNAEDDDSEVTTITIKKKGRPAGTKRKIGAKHSGRSKLASKDAIAEVDMEEDLDTDGVMMATPSNMSSESAGDSSHQDAYTTITNLLKDPKTEIGSQARNHMMRLVRQLVANKVEEEGAKPDFLDMDKDGDKKEPMKKAVADKKEKKVDETTTSGSVATAPVAPKAGKGMQFGKGVYESLSTKLENMISEGMNVSINMGTDDGSGETRKSITVTADGDDADKLAELLKMAGLGGQVETCPTCGEANCGCGAEMVDENSPDWPTNTEKLDAQPELRTYSGGLNGPKSTGQTTIPVVASQLRRQASMEEGVKLERSLFNTWKNYKG